MKTYHITIDDSQADIMRTLDIHIKATSVVEAVTQALLGIEEITGFLDIQITVQRL